MAGLITGLTSFGSNLIAVPLLTFVTSARDSIIIGCFSATCIFITLALIYWRSIVWSETLLLVTGALVSVPAGTWFLKYAGSSLLLFAAGFSLIIFLLWQFALTRLRKKQARAKSWLALLMGLASGIMMGGVGMGGPPLVLFAYLRDYTPPVAISTINAASAVIMAAALSMQYVEGLYTADLLISGMDGALAAIIGILISIPLVKRLDVSFFRKLLLLMLALSAFALIGRAIIHA